MIKMTDLNIENYDDETIRETLKNVLNYSETIVENFQPLVEDDNMSAKGAIGIAEDIIKLIHEELNKNIS